MNPPRQNEFGWPGGDKPGDIVFENEVPRELRDALAKLLGPLLGQILDVRALTPPSGAIGRCAVATPQQNFFVRVSARWFQPQLEQAITQFLHERGVPVNHLLQAGLTLEFGGERLRVDVRELISARHFDGSLRDLRALAGALEACHANLREFPLAKEVAANAAVRFQHLADVREMIHDALNRGDWHFFSYDENWPKAHEHWLRELIANYEPRLDLRPAAQTLHAQIHRANVLYTLEHGEPVLVDFEEAVQTFAPVQWDLAYFVQRFCLHGDPPAEAVADRLRAVREAYGAPLGDIAEMMRQVAWFSFAVIVDLRSQGVASPVSEYEKFVRLEQQARSLQDFLKS